MIPLARSKGLAFLFQDLMPRLNGVMPLVIEQARAELHIAHGYLASKLESMRPHNVTHVTCIIAKHIV